MAGISQEIVGCVRQMDLLTYLRRYEPEELVHFSGSTYCTRTHDSLKISNGKWYWWSRGIGGRSALDYLIKVKGLEFRQAVEILAGAPQSSVAEKIAKQKEEAIKLIQLPPRHANNRRVFAYLSRRGIDPEIIRCCIKSGLLYEEARHHNCVFLGFDGQTPKYAMLRGTHSGSTFVGEVPGSDKRFSFAFPRLQKQSSALWVFESAVDALSFLTMEKEKGKEWETISCLSLGGIARMTEGKLPGALEWYLKEHRQTKEIHLCLDNDPPGRKAARWLREQLADYRMMDAPPVRGKDYNDFLQMQKGIWGQVKMRGEARG